VDLQTIALSGITEPIVMTNGYLFIAQPPVNRWITIAFPLATQSLTLHHRTRQINVRLQGDAVVAMQNFGADLTFFEPL
jgi:hypothetical protein